MEITRVHGILDELIAAQGRSLLPRLLESTVSVGSQAAGELEIVRRLVAEEGTDTQRLVDTLMDLDGMPGPSVGEITSADFHYVDLDVLLPRVVADQQQLAARYQAAAEALSGCAPAEETVRGIGARQRARLEYLRKLAESAPAGA
ncbi:MAG: hypothetical protein ACYSVY_24870 [Planctomycetota bacterium]|jgi:hypothetical protein